MDYEVLSDIHLEKIKSYPEIKPRAHILFLPGDIGFIDDYNFQEFLKYCSEHWLFVFFVPGNHEYYSDQNYADLRQKYIRFTTKFDNVVCLDRQKIVLSEVDILGCTLWSHPSRENTNDFLKITLDDRRKFTLQDLQDLHKKDRKWLLENYNPKKPTIIMTHFQVCDHMESKNPLYIDREYNLDDYFYNNLPLKPEKGVPLICISGHSHWSFDFEKNGVRYISNQIGYLDEICNYNDNKTWPLSLNIIKK